ncbi:hypothetical protein CsSME_00015092 [Camellia sinensis var. sinensis]
MIGVNALTKSECSLSARVRNTGMEVLGLVKPIEALGFVQNSFEVLSSENMDPLEESPKDRDLEPDQTLEASREGRTMRQTDLKLGSMVTSEKFQEVTEVTSKHESSRPQGDGDRGLAGLEMVNQSRSVETKGVIPDSGGGRPIPSQQGASLVTESTQLITSSTNLPSGAKIDEGNAFLTPVGQGTNPRWSEEVEEEHNRFRDLPNSLDVARNRGEGKQKVNPREVEKITDTEVPLVDHALIPKEGVGGEEVVIEE